jgi:hypothetical protein
VFRRFPGRVCHPGGHWSACSVSGSRPSSEVDRWRGSFGQVLFRRSLPERGVRAFPAPRSPVIIMGWPAELLSQNSAAAIVGTAPGYMLPFEFLTASISLDPAELAGKFVRTIPDGTDVAVRAVRGVPQYRPRV